jgi:hypothetical protein
MLFAFAVQHQHLAYQAKGTSKRYHIDELNFWRSYAEHLLDSKAEAIIEPVFDSLEELVRESKLIEMVNSLIRP